MKKICASLILSIHSDCISSMAAVYFFHQQQQNDSIRRKREMQKDTVIRMMESKKTATKQYGFMVYRRTYDMDVLITLYKIIDTDSSYEKIVKSIQDYITRLVINKKRCNILFYEITTDPTIVSYDAIMEWGQRVLFIDVFRKNSKKFVRCIGTSQFYNGIIASLSYVDNLDKYIDKISQMSKHQLYQEYKIINQPVPWFGNKKKMVEDLTRREKLRLWVMLSTTI